jgi:hypothetical protein
MVFDGDQVLTDCEDKVVVHLGAVSHLELEQVVTGGEPVSPLAPNDRETRHGCLLC